MIAELSILITLSCGGFQPDDQLACQKASEAYLIQSHADQAASKIMDYAESKTRRHVGQTTLILAGVGAKYAATQSVQYKVKLASVTAGIDKSRSDFKQSLQLDFLRYFLIKTDHGHIENSVMAGINLGF